MWHNGNKIRHNIHFDFNFYNFKISKTYCMVMVLGISSCMDFCSIYYFELFNYFNYFKCGDIWKKIMNKRIQNY